MAGGILLVAAGQSPSTLPFPQAPPRDAQARSDGAGSIRGRVTAVETGAPLRRALLTIAGQPSGNEIPVVATDDDGRYAFNGLPAGSYTLTVAKAGYVSLAYGQRRPGEPGRPVQVGVGQAVNNVDFSVPRGGVIVAHIMDDLGEPITGLYVRALRKRFMDGESQLVPAGPTTQGLATNGAGEARFQALVPGDYFVVAASSSFVGAAGSAGGTRMFTPTYYPGTASSTEARPVTVRLGQLVDVQFSLVPARPARVSGTIRTSDGAPFTTSSIFLNYRSPGGSGGRNMLAQADGSFGLTNVMPGDYSIDAAPFSATAGVQEFASMPIHVDEEDVTGLVLTSGAGGTVRGRIVFDTGSAPANVKPGSIVVSSVPPVRRPGGPSGRRIPTSDWTFGITGLFTPIVLRLNGGLAAAPVSGPAASSSNGWFLKAVMIDGKDVTDIPLDLSGSRDLEDVEVIVTQQRTRISGTAVDSRVVPTADYAAVLFPVNRDQWTPQSSRIAAARPDQQGRFTIVGLPPGNYLAAAVEYLEIGSERDPDLLVRLKESATQVMLGEGEAKTISLRLP